MKNRLKVLRAEKKLSQAELARQASVSRQTINAIETEKYDPSLPLAFRLARIFELRIEDVFTPEEAGKSKVDSMKNDESTWGKPRGSSGQGPA